MSFFQEEKDDSNLQYDDTAFLYFVASALIVASTVTLCFIVNQLRRLSIPNRKLLAANPLYHRPLKNLEQLKRKQVFNLSLLGKLLLFAILVGLVTWVYFESSQGTNKMKGFDPFEILGVKQGATLREIKKAYRALALEYHPDRNQGNPQAQTKFILISKSYQCFTNEEKRANCFKYGNPDGAETFRVGIGLPNFFIKTEYQFYVLPIVLAIFLVIIPGFIVRETNKNREIAPTGIKFESIDGLVKCNQVKPRTQFETLYRMASFVELSEDFGLGPISPQEQQMLESEMDQNPYFKNALYEGMSAQQRKVLFELYKYMSGMGQFSHPGFAQKLESLFESSLLTAVMGCNREICKEPLMGNPSWKLEFWGFESIQLHLLLLKDYYCRSLCDLDKSRSWLYALDLTTEERNIIAANPVHNFHAFLGNEEGVKHYVNSLFHESRRPHIFAQLDQVPVMHVEAKMKVGDTEVDQICPSDYPEIYFKVTKLNKTNFCPLIQYPLPKPLRFFLFAVLDQEVIFFKTIEFKDPSKREMILKESMRFGTPRALNIDIFVYSDCYHTLDVGTQLQINVVDTPPELKARKVVLHPDDMHLQKRKKTFFEEAMDMQLSPEDNELSDSEGEEEEKREMREQQ